jgi:Ni2+-binding GTPase involved in maturation of urease and hydrogenase
MLEEYKTRRLSPNSLFLVNGNHYIVGAVGSGKTTLMSKLIVIYKKVINPYIIYFSSYGPDETMALNLNSKGITI